MNRGCRRASASYRSSSTGNCTVACRPKPPGRGRVSHAWCARCSPRTCSRRVEHRARAARCCDSAGSRTASCRPSTSTASCMAAERLVVDTWGWLSLADDREPRHRHVRQVVAELGRAAGTAVTTDYILDETLTLVFRRLPFARARRFMATLDTAEQ